jgi:surfactin synthase thioesterase subunit
VTALDPVTRAPCDRLRFGSAEDQSAWPSEAGEWKRVIAGDLSIPVFGGEHFDLDDLRDPLVADVADHI